jgi:integrase
LANVPRAITWDEVRDMLGCVDRRCALGRRDYAMLLLLVAYGLRGNEVAQLTLEDIDWQHERLNVPQRKAGHWSAYPLASVVAEAIIDYLKNARPQTTDRHVFFRSMAPWRPITSAAVSSAAVRYLQRAGVQVHRAGAHTLRHYLPFLTMSREARARSGMARFQWLCRAAAARLPDIVWRSTGR